jgi:hypothetical protein
VPSHSSSESAEETSSGSSDTIKLVLDLSVVKQSAFRTAKEER